VYTFTKPEKAWNSFAGESLYGWRVCGTVNANNGFGVYVGEKPFYALIRDNKVVTFIHKGFAIPGSFKLWLLSDYPGFYDSLCK
jgi:hypothetical protein